MKHTPADMTVTLEAGETLAALQTALARSGQWLPLDPPNLNLTLREILDRNESGPHRYGYGTVRDYVIGLKVMLGDGRLVKSGGQVVKNVAGYDLQKLFIGSRGTLGIIQEITFKLRPLPETERFTQQPCASLDAANAIIEAVVASELTPVVFDLHRDDAGKLTLVLGFDGTNDEVEWQTALAITLGFQDGARMDYDKTFRSDDAALHKISVLPSKLIETLRALEGHAFVARAGNGIIFHRANIAATNPALPTHLLRRMKDAFDPQHLLPELHS